MLKMHLVARICLIPSWQLTVFPRPLSSFYGKRFQVLQIAMMGRDEKEGAEEGKGKGKETQKGRQWSATPTEAKLLNME